MVDNFGVKYVGKEHANHLKSSIRIFYPIADDWTGSLYYGITLKLDYQKLTVDSAIPEYVSEALHKYQQETMQHQQQSPHIWEQNRYGVNQKTI